MNLPGYRLHRLKGDRADTWSVTVSGNWRVTFTFEGEDAFDVDLEDYHWGIDRCRTIGWTIERDDQRILARFCARMSCRQQDWRRISLRGCWASRDARWARYYTSAGLWLLTWPTAWRAPSARRRRCGWVYSRTSISGTRITLDAQSTSASNESQRRKRHKKILNFTVGTFVGGLERFWVLPSNRAFRKDQ